MILYTDATTPFGRKCLVAALERGIVLEERFVKLSDPKEFLLVNPLNQIPALSVDQQKYYDSDVILQFLDSLHEGPPLIPEKNKYKHLTSIHLANAVPDDGQPRQIPQIEQPGAQAIMDVVIIIGDIIA